MAENVSGGLRWVKGEIATTLRRVRDLVETFGTTGDRGSLNDAVNALFEVRGVLLALQLPLPARLVEEMQRLAESMSGETDRSPKEAAEVLMLALIQLPNHLDRLDAGAELPAFSLLPTINDLRESRGAPPLHQAELLVPDTVPTERDDELAQEDLEALSVVVRKVRPHFHRHLVAWYRPQTSADGLTQLSQLFGQLHRYVKDGRLAKLFRLAEAYAERLGVGEVASGPKARALIGHLDRVLKRLALNPPEWPGTEATQLIDELLAALAHSDVRSPPVDDFQDSSHGQAAQTEIRPEGADEALAGLAATMLGEVADIKSQLDLFARGNRDDRTPLNAIGNPLRALARTLKVADSGRLPGRLSALADAFAELAKSGAGEDMVRLEPLATELLAIETLLHAYAERRPLPSEAEGAGGLFASEFATTTFREAKGELVRVKDAVLACETPGARPAVLGEIPERMGRIGGALTVLGKDAAAQLCKNLSGLVQRRYLAVDRWPRESELERLADAVVALEVYIEQAIEEGATHGEELIDRARKSLADLDRILAPGLGAVFPPLSAPPEQSPSTPATLAPIPVETSLASDLLGVFLEEAREEISIIDAQLALLQSQPDNATALGTLRRSFHTLKGSGRLAGAERVAALSEVTEELLSRATERAMVPDGRQLDFASEVAGLLPDLVSADAEGQEFDVADLLARGRLLTREPVLELVPVAAGVPSDAEVASTPAATPTGIPEHRKLSGEVAPESVAAETIITEPPALFEDRASALASDEELLEIFRSETEEHLDGLKDFLDRAGKSDLVPEESAVRALHTLAGSARMAGIGSIGTVTKPLELRLRQLQETDRPLDAALAALLGRAVAGVAQRVAELPEAGAGALALAALAQELAAEGAAEPVALSETPPQETPLAETLGPEGSRIDSQEIAASAETGSPLLPSSQWGFYAEETGEAPDTAAPSAPEGALGSEWTLGLEPTAESEFSSAAEWPRPLAPVEAVAADLSAESEGLEAAPPLADVLKLAPHRELEDERLSRIAAEELSIELDLALSDMSPPPETGAHEPIEMSDELAEPESEPTSDDFEGLSAPEFHAPYKLQQREPERPPQPLAEIGTDTTASEFAPEEASSPLDLPIETSVERAPKPARAAPIQPEEEPAVAAEAVELESESVPPETLETEDTDKPVAPQVPEAEVASKPLAAEAPQVEAAPAPVAAEAASEPVPESEPQVAQPIVLPTPLPNTVAPALAGVAEPEVTDEYQSTPLDPELATLFLEDARDLLDGIDSRIREWQFAPQETSVLAGINRILHTLKGSARLTGLTAIGDLSHALETRLTAVGSHQGAGDDTALELAQRGADALSIQVDALERGKPIPRALALVEALNRPVRPEATTAKVHSDVAILRPAPLPPKPPAETEALQPHKAPSSFAAMVAERERGGAVGSAPLIRVRADLLNRLVDNSGEISLYRARLSQRNGLLGFGLGELDQTVVRLRDRLRLLEIETEAQILHRFEREGLSEEDGAVFDPLELDRFSTLQQLSRSLAETVNDLVSLKELLGGYQRETADLLTQQARLAEDLQDGLLRTRMVHFVQVVPRLHRLVRQTADSTRKSARLEVIGPEVELDRTILDRLVSPLEHLLRNAVDHGLETPERRTASGKPAVGTIALALSREGNDVVIALSDDGRGLDLDAIRRKAIAKGLLAPDAEIGDDALMQMVFERGFTTHEHVTQISGRGVGLDVVTSEIKAANGSIALSSVPGLGTTFTIRLPLTLAIIEAFLVSTGDNIYAVPHATIEGAARIGREDLAAIYRGRRDGFDYRGQHYRVAHLGSVLDFRQEPELGERRWLPLLLARLGDQRVALQVDNILESQRIVVKPLGAQLSSVRWLSGGTILPDGRVALILDALALLRSKAIQDYPPSAAATAGPAVAPRCVMVVDDSLTVRRVTSRLLRKQNMEVLTAKDGVEALTLLGDRIPDLMLLDIEMPRMDGYELTRHIRRSERLRHLPIIMITSRAGDKHREHALSLGVNRYLGKPYQETELLEEIDSLLGDQRP